MSKTFIAHIPIRFSDCDQFGHVNHAKYLTYCEDHRSEMFNVMGQECGSWLLQSGFVVVSVSVRYLRPLTLLNHSVEIACTVQGFGESSMRLHYLISSDGDGVADVISTLVVTDGARPRLITADERSWLSLYLEEASEMTEE